MKYPSTDGSRKKVQEKITLIIEMMMVVKFGARSIMLAHSATLLAIANPAGSVTVVTSQRCQAGLSNVAIRNSIDEILAIVHRKIFLAFVRVK